MALDQGYYDRLKEASITPVWNRPRASSVRVAPHIWRWDMMEAFIREAADNEGLDALGERRSLSMVNPGYQGQRHGIISTQTTAVQLIKPGEIATAHRHPAAALRFIMHGSDAYTIVDGEKMYMEEGDLVLTPSMMYHDHAHAGFTDQDMIWMDVLDGPLSTFLEVMGGDQYPEDVQPITKPAGYSAGRVGRGFMRNFGDVPTDRTLPLGYKWEDSYGALLDSTQETPFDGVAMEYINPITGGHTFPNMAVSLQRLRPGEHTRTHRHNHSTVYNAAKGSGFTIVDGVRMDWNLHDIFCVPSGAWHEHGNSSDSDDAVLFSVSNLPVVENADLAREEEGDSQEVTETR